MIRLHQINSDPHTAFLRCCAQIHAHRSSAVTTDPVCSERPAVVQLQPMCGRAAAASRSPAAGNRSSNEAKGCGHDVTACIGRSEALATKYWRRMAKIDLQQVSIMLLGCEIYVFIVLVWLEIDWDVHVLCFKW